MDDQSGKHLLIVEDDDSMRSILARLLKEYNIELAADGEHALELLRTQHFDGLLLDLKLPDMDGIDILHKVRETGDTAGLPVIIVTARTDGDALLETASANVLVLKPFAPAVLRSAVEIATHIVQ
jgi:DNA-binding response OmpR family regulator